MTRAFFDTKSSLTQHSAIFSGSTARSVLLKALLALLAVWCVTEWILTAHFVTRFYVALPVMDYWRVPYWLPQIRAMNLHYLWVQHNEHRIVFPDLVFAADVWLLHGRRVLPIALSFICYFGCWLVVSWLWLREREPDRSGALAAGLIAGIVIGWKGAALALADPFLIQWTLLSLATLISLSALAAVREAASAAALAVSILSAFVATYSSANGLILWPVLIVASLLLRVTKRQVMFLALSGILSVGIYFIGYKSDAPPHLTAVLGHPLCAGMFVCSFLSMPFGAMKSPQFGVYVGSVNLLLTAFLLWLSLYRRGDARQQRASIVFGGWYVFVILSALLVAAGRMDPGDSTFTAAKALRYLPLVTVNWGVCLSLLVATSARRRWRRFPALVCGCTLVILLALAFFKLRFWFEKSGQIFSEQQLAELSVENGLMDPALLTYIFTERSFVANLLPVMKAARVSIYYQDSGRYLGERLSQTAAELPTGQTTYVRNIDSGVEVIGWASDIAGRQILLANSAHQIIGTGRHLRNGLPWNLVPHGVAPGSAWVAFIPQPFEKQPFRAYLMQ